MKKDLTTLSKAKSLKGQILDEWYRWRDSCFTKERVKLLDKDREKMVEIAISKTSQLYEKKIKRLEKKIEDIEEDEGYFEYP